MMAIGEQRDVAFRNSCLRAIATEAKSQDLGITPEMGDDIMASKEGE